MSAEPITTLVVTDCEVHTEVSITRPNIVGVADIILNDQLAIDGIPILYGENGLYIGYPEKIGLYGTDCLVSVHPITGYLHREIATEILTKFNTITGGRYK